MKIYLISATHYHPDGRLVKSIQYWTSAITLPYLKALTPREHEVVFTDELMQDADLNSDADVIGITAMGPQIKRAYDLADLFRRRGKKVVMGGSWVSLNPDQALEHCDAVVIGEVETVWKDCLEDLAAGRNKVRYQADKWHSLVGLPQIDYMTLPLLRPDLWKKSAFYRQYFHWPVSASRGCPHPCEYCTVQTYYDRSFRSRPVEEVVEDFRRIKALGGKKVLILDDNPIGNVSYAKELFRALIPIKMAWASQCTINIARNADLLDLAARSGCRTLSIGLESVTQENLEEISKGFNKAPRFAEDLKAIRDKGIQVIALMMVGLDGDDTKSFDKTLQFLVDNKLSFLKLFTPCPYPGTKYYDDMDRAGRILTKDWNRYDYGSPLIQPTHMTPEEMMVGFNDVYKRFYSIPNIVRRMTPPPKGNYLESMFYMVANFKINRYMRKTPAAWGTIS
ncbi:MAG: B12-binding domain-containing radical SAM protein [Myxococcales bacterium]|nr:B12-binding domain-containing radical SAM protein [Myxococcales bacterium]